MRKPALALLALILPAASLAPAADEPARVVERPQAAAGNAFHVGNRAPLLASPLVKLPVGAVKPQGWVRRQLELEADGFTGRLPELSEFLREEENAWLSPEGQGHSYWEEVPYWLKGFVDLGYVLGDERIIQEGRKWIEAALAGQQVDGWFGPRANLNSKRRGTPGKPDLWPNMIMLNVLQSYYEFSGDKRVIDLMTRYFRWQLAVPDEDFLPPFWQQQRAGDNLASVYWLYNRTGDGWLLELATKIHRNMAPWSQEVPNWHGVNICQCFRSPTIYWMQSRKPDHLAGAERNYQTVMDLYGQVPGGMFGADENCREGYSGPRQAAESCSMAEMMLSCEMLLAATGQPRWADRCEDVAFNSFPACMTADLKALRYLTAPNMVLSDRRNKSPGVQNRGPMLLFDPHLHRCCQHNIGHAWPRYAQHLWLAAPANGLAAVLYAPCRVTAKVADGTEVTVAESTRYPFDEMIELKISTPKSVSFPLYLRVPGWCQSPSVKINGRNVRVTAGPESYILIDRRWSDGDVVNLELPMRVVLKRWAKNHNSVSVHRGPLAYSLLIGEKYVRVGGTDDWPAWEIHPTSPWNFGLVLDEADPASSFEVVSRPWPKDEQPFEAAAAPVQLRAKARRIPPWKLDYLGLVGPMNPSPVKSDEPVEAVTLIPMGCARLRIAAFPVIGAGPDAKEWTEPTTSVPWAASHCWHGDSVIAICDNVLPRSSGDGSIPRFTWWDHRGTTEWAACSFSEPRTVKEVEVYWFDDTGRGHCRVPASWRVEWLDGETWRPVSARGEYGVEPDRFNKAAFEPVTTKQVRLIVELEPEFSAGILECRVK